MQRLEAALASPTEDAWIEYKTSGAWDALKWKLVKAAMAMANLRDGGLIVLGVREQKGQLSPTGVEPSHLETFEPDAIHDLLAKHSDALPRVHVGWFAWQGMQFVCFDIPEFEELPVICKKASPDKVSKQDRLRAGAVYIRTRHGRAATVQVTESKQLRDVLDLAGEKRARKIVQQARATGMTTPDPQTKYRDERGDL